MRTSEELAKEAGVSERTIRRWAKFAEAVDKIASYAGAEVRERILAKDSQVTQKDTVKLAKEHPIYYEDAINELLNGKNYSAAMRIAEYKFGEKVSNGEIDVDRMSTF